MSNDSPTYYWDPFIKRWYFYNNEDDARIELDVEKLKTGNTKRAASVVHIDILVNELASTCPSLGFLIEYIQGLTEEEQTENEKLQGEINDTLFAKERLCEICILRAIQYGIRCSKRYAADLEDTIQNALLGAFQAINTYSEGPFFEHLKNSMREEVLKGVPIGEHVCSIPWRMKPTVRSIMQETEIEYSDFSDSVDYYEHVSNTVKSMFNCSNKSANNLASLLVEPLNIDLLIETEDSSLSDAGLGDEELVDKAYQAQAKDAIDQVIGTLKSKKAKDIIYMRFGFYGEPMTYAAIGKEIGLTGSRVGQIGFDTLQKLRHPSRKLYRYSNLFPNIQMPKSKKTNKSTQNKTAHRSSGADKTYNYVNKPAKTVKRNGAEFETVKTITHEKKNGIKREVMELHNEFGTRTIIFEY